MRTSTLVAVLLAAAAGTATAQTPDQQPPPDPNNPNPNPNPNPTPIPPDPVPVQQPPPQPNPSPVSPIPEPMPAPAQDGWRPPEFSIGIGIGYQFPTSLETPNVATVRFRLPTGLTFEPTLALASTTDTVDTGDPVDDKTTQLGIGTLIRFPMVGHGRVDLELLGAINVDNVNSNPDGEDDETTTTAVTLNYGLAVTSWINRHWAVSFSALNPLVSFAKVRQEMGPMNVLVTSTTTLGAIFDPTVLVTVHLYH
jgi:outer membrane biosynthesis protein TonB